MRLADKVAIVTGGANGMGAAECRLFAREGARVVVADVRDGDGKTLVDQITSAGGQARYAHLDVTQETEWQHVVSFTVETFGKLDILVNNAGISGGIASDIMSTSAYDRLMEVNAKGVFLGMKHAIPAMQRAGGGSIINISSISGIAGQTVVHMGYNASKGAVRVMTKSAAVQHAQHGIRVNSVHPGVMPPMLTSNTDPEVRARRLKPVPMRREGRLDEVAYAVLFLASDEASYITGAELVVDGGYLAV
jgi:NAD(P)-dependent dehydrogenase (short-subunit alcohol dehydrogenase family)